MKYSFLIFILLLACSSVNRIEKKTYYPDNKLNEEFFEIDGKKDGLYKQYSENGKLAAEGFYKNGIMDGIFKSYYENGNLLSIINYQNNEPININTWDQSGKHVIIEGNGTLILYFNDGTPRLKQSYKNNKKNGTWTFWYENGRMHEVIEFCDDKRISFKLWDENGNLLEEKYYNK